MVITYDARHNIAYIRFREKRAQVDTLRISDELNVDIAPDGTVYGIELLNAREQLSPGQVLRVINEDNGTQTDVKLSA